MLIVNSSIPGFLSFLAQVLGVWCVCCAQFAVGGCFCQCTAEGHVGVWCSLPCTSVNCVLFPAFFAQLAHTAASMELIAGSCSLTALRAKCLWTLPYAFEMSCWTSVSVDARVVFQVACQKPVSFAFLCSCSLLRISFSIFIRLLSLIPSFPSSTLCFCFFGMLSNTLGATKKSMLVRQRDASHSLSSAISAACALSLINFIMFVVTLGRTVLGIHSMVAGAGSQEFVQRSRIVVLLFVGLPSSFSSSCDAFVCLVFSSAFRLILICAPHRVSGGFALCVVHSAASFANSHP